MHVFAMDTEEKILSLNYPDDDGEFSFGISLMISLFFIVEE